jgi:hypothetical protein
MIRRERFVLFIALLWPFFIATVMIGSAINGSFLPLRKAFVERFYLLFIPYVVILLCLLLVRLEIKTKLIVAAICVIGGVSTYLLYMDYINPY